MSKFFRCDICEYNNIFGSELTDTHVSKTIKVRFYPEHNRFLCTDCIREINGVSADYAREDLEKDGA